MSSRRSSNIPRRFSEGYFPQWYSELRANGEMRNALKDSAAAAGASAGGGSAAAAVAAEAEVAQVENYIDLTGVSGGSSDDSPDSTSSSSDDDSSTESSLDEDATAGCTGYERTVTRVDPVEKRNVHDAVMHVYKTVEYTCLDCGYTTPNLREISIHTFVGRNKKASRIPNGGQGKF